MDLIELGPQRDSLVGADAGSGLTAEQRKRLTIAVELVANPSILFLVRKERDEWLGGEGWSGSSGSGS